MLFLACNSFFSAAKSSWQLQTARSFLIVIVISPMTGQSQSHSFLLFLSGEKRRFDLLRGKWNNLIECVLLFASCSFTSVALKYRQITSVRQQFLSICCLPPSFASVYSGSFGRYIFLCLLQTRTLVFFSVR